MKRSILLLVAFGMVCMFLNGCALFHSRQSGAAKSPGGQSSASAEGGFPDNTGGTNQTTATITSGGTITTTVSGGKVTTVANTGPAGAASSPGGLDSGTSTPAGHGPLFYFYILFAAALVIWVLWALWHSYHRQRPARVRYRRRR